MRGLEWGAVCWEGSEKALEDKGFSGWRKAVFRERAWGGVSVRSCLLHSWQRAKRGYEFEMWRLRSQSCPAPLGKPQGDRVAPSGPRSNNKAEKTVPARLEEKLLSSGAELWTVLRIHVV